MPEFSVDVPVWHWGDQSGSLGEEGLLELGVSRALIERLRAWQAGWEHDPLTRSPLKEFRSGSPLSVRIAQHLQRELPDYRIFLDGADGPRPIDEWTD